MNQSSDLAQLLKDQDLDPLVATILQRNLKQRIERQSPYLDGIFNAVTGYQDQIRSFLTDLQSHWGEWQMVNARQIQFTTSAANETYNHDENLIQASAQSAHDALDAWSNQAQAR